MDRHRQILGHLSIHVDGLDARTLKVLNKFQQFLIAVERGAVAETTGPCEDGRDGIGGRLPALLMLAIVTRDGA